MNSNNYDERHPVHDTCEWCGKKMLYQEATKEESELGKYTLISKTFSIMTGTLVEKEGPHGAWITHFEKEDNETDYVCDDCKLKFMKMFTELIHDIKGG